MTDDRVNSPLEEVRMPSQPNTPRKRGGQAPPAGEKDRPEQNIGYDEAVKGGPLDAEERAEAVSDSPLTPDAGEDDETGDDTVEWTKS